MVRKHSRDEILDGAVTVAGEVGLARLSFGRVAAHLGIRDRTVVYYFPTKADLTAAVMAAVGRQLQDTLAAAFTEVAADHRALLRAAWPVLATTEADPTFALFFEAMGLAAAGQDPYHSLMPLLMEAWVDWVATFLDPDGDDQAVRAEAAATVAVMDGLLLIRQMSGPEAADQAAARLGIT